MFSLNMLNMFSVRHIIFLMLKADRFHTKLLLAYMFYSTSINLQNHKTEL